MQHRSAGRRGRVSIYSLLQIETECVCSVPNINSCILFMFYLMSRHLQHIHFLCTDSSKLRLCVCSPWTKWPKIRKYLHLVVLYVVVKGSSSNGLDMPGVLSTCEPGLPSPPAQHNSKVFHKAGQHTNDHSYLHLYTLLLLNSIPSFNSV